jgi:uncharacterized membrane protein
MEASVPSPAEQTPQTSSFNWPAMMRTLLVQVFVLLALAGAFAAYVEWSSNATWAEFSAAGNPSTRESSHHTLTSTAVQTVKNQAPCKPKG